MSVIDRLAGLDKVRVQEDRISIVETIRGLAALAVCLFHFTKTNVSFQGTNLWYTRIATHGWIGVEAFFVLSGFIIPYSMIRSGYTSSRFFQFFAKRCLRIEPPYILSILIVLLLTYVGAQVPGYRGEPFHLNVPQVLTHIAYLPEHFGFTWLLPVYWSLEAEFYFYILIGLFIPLLWKSKMSFVVGMCVALLSSFFLKLSVFSYAPLFVMGLSVCAYKFSKIDKYVFWSLLCLAVATSLVRGQYFMMPLTGIITALAIVHISYSSTITAFLGKISYSLYLMHIPIGSRILNLGGRYADNEWKVWALLVFALAVTIFVSWIFYKLVERPAQRLSKKVVYK